MNPEELPLPHEIGRWLLDSVKHSVHIEYYLEILQIGRSDPQRPHDLIGPGNKFEWEAIRGFAMQYRNQPGMFEKYVKPSLEFHRQQIHHQAWNEFNPKSTPDEMRLGAVDAVCSLLEPRGYQGGCHTWEEIYSITEKNPIHKVAWMHLVKAEMEKIQKPNFDQTTLMRVERNGIDTDKYDIIVGRLHQALDMLEDEHGIIVP